MGFLIKSGRDPVTKLACLGTVGAHFAVAATLRGGSFLPWLGATSIIGPMLAHAIGVLIHETSHNLVARGTAANKAWSIFLNLPLGAPAAIDFRAQHLLHHRHLGEGGSEESRDTQSPTVEEDRWVGSSSFCKVLSFTLGRFIWKGRPANGVPASCFWSAHLWSAPTLGALSRRGGPADKLVLRAAELGRLIVDYFLDARYRVSHYVGLGGESLGEAAVRSGRLEGTPEVFPDFAGRPGDCWPESGLFGVESEREWRLPRRSSRRAFFRVFRASRGA